MNSKHGLVAPVVRNADQLSLEQMSATISLLRTKADANSLQRTEFVNGPFAISNLGTFGIDHFDAFLFYGQTAVLSVGRATEDADNGTWAWFGLTADHRVVDGADAAQFLETLQQEIAQL